MQAVSYRWVILTLSYLCMLSFAFTLQSLPPILPLVIQELRLSHAQAGLLMSFFSLPAIFSILSGLLSDRWGPSRTGMISLLLLILGTLFFGSSGTFLYAGLGRMIAGMGGVTVMIVAAQIVSQWFRGYEVGTAMGIYHTAMPVGAILSFTTFGSLGTRFGWRIPIFFSMGIAVVSLVVFWLLYRPLPHVIKGIAEEKNPAAGLFSSLREMGVAIWLVGFCWMWFNAVVISFLTFAPDFFVSKGYSIGFAGFLASLLMWGSLIINPIIGRIVDAFDHKELFIGTGGIIIALTLFLITQTSRYVIPMVSLAISVALIPTPVFSFPLKVLKPENLGLGFGILSSVSGIGTFLGPYIAGLVRDKTGSYETSFLVLATVAILISVTALCLKMRMRRIGQQKG